MKNVKWLIILCISSLVLFNYNKPIKPEHIYTINNVMDKIIQVESGGNPDAIGRDGEVGLCQLTPAAVEQVGYNWIRVCKSPNYNRQCGEAYLQWCLDRFPDRIGGDRWFMAVCTYNWGIGNMCKYERGEHQIPNSVCEYAYKVLGERTSYDN